MHLLAFCESGGRSPRSSLCRLTHCRIHRIKRVEGGGRASARKVVDLEGSEQVQVQESYPEARDL